MTLVIFGSCIRTLGIITRSLENSNERNKLMLGILSVLNIAACLFVLYFSSRKLTDAQKAANRAQEFAEAHTNTAQEASGSSHPHSKTAQYHAEDAKEQ